MRKAGKDQIYAKGTFPIWPINCLGNGSAIWRRGGTDGTYILRFLRAEWHPNLFHAVVATTKRSSGIRGELFPTHSNRRNSRLPVEDCTVVQRLVRCAFRTYTRSTGITEPVTCRLSATIYDSDPSSHDLSLTQHSLWI